MPAIRKLETVEQHLVEVITRTKRVYMELSTTPIEGDQGSLALGFLQQLGNLIALDSEIIKIMLVTEEKAKGPPQQRVIPLVNPKPR